MVKVAIPKGRPKGSKNKTRITKRRMTPKRKPRKKSMSPNIAPPGWLEIILTLIFRGMKLVLTYINQGIKKIKAKRLSEKRRDINEED